MPRPGFTVVITPDPEPLDPREPRGYAARYAGGGRRVGRGLTPWGAVLDLVEGGKPGKGLDAPCLGKLALPETED